jgi:hypothetical protein
MGQREIRDQLSKLCNVIARNSLTCEEIVRNRKIDPNLSLLHHTELSGKVPSGSHVSVEKYGTLGDKLDYGTARSAR